MRRADSARAKAEERFQPFILLEAKVHMPPPRPGIVERRALLEKLTSSPDARVVLISAPAGYGKTTLTSEWSRADERPFAYIGLDESDNDNVVMLAYVALALQHLGVVDAGLIDELRTPEPAVGRAVLPRIANDMGARKPFVLVLDDVHHLVDERCLRSVGYLVENMPPGSQIVLAGRSAPDIPLARMRVAGDLLELRADDLAFDQGEAARLFEAVGLHLEPERIAELLRRTEGWPAGLYLSALYLLHADDPSRRIELFRGDHRDVADYFVSEVLANRPQESVEFLMRTSILERLCGPLCDAVLESRGSATVLREMEHSNLFLIPLDDRREWYRYQSLFEDLLLAQLYAREPEIVPELHRRAGHWYEAQGFVGGCDDELVPSSSAFQNLTPKYFESALHHLLAAGEASHAADLLASHWRPFAASGRLASLKRMLDDFSDEEVERHPPLALTAAWTHHMLGDGGAARRWLPFAEELEDSDDARQYLSSLALLRASIACEGIPGMRRDIQLAYDTESLFPTSWFPVSRMAAGILPLFQGDREAVKKALLEAVASERQFPDSLMQALSTLALVALEEGDWPSAERQAREAYRLAQEHALVPYGISMLTQGVFARVLAHDGDHEGAREVLAELTPLLRREPPQWWQLVWVLLITTETQLEIGDIEAAEWAVARARREIASREDAGVLPARLATVQSAVGLRLMPEPLSPSELRVLAELPEEMSLSQIAHDIYLSRNTVKTHVRSIYRKLGVASREEAVEVGRDLGLLC